MKELRTTLDGRHWALEDSNRASRRSHPPTGDPGRAPSKPRSFAPPTSSIPSRVLFPPSSQEGTPSFSYGIGNSSDFPSDFDGDDTVILRPSSAFDETHRSFVDDFLPPGLTSSHLLSGSGAVTSAVSSVTGAVLNTTAAAVRTFFPSGPRQSSHEASEPLHGASEPQQSPRASPEFPSSHRTSDTMASSGAPAGTNPAAPLPTLEQFLEMQRKHDELQRQLDNLVALQSADQRARVIEDDIEGRRKTAYEQAGLPYVPNTRLGGHPPAPARPSEYRISHKSVGYLRPADASHKPFEAVDGEVYVRPLAWLAHLRTKLELREDFQFKNQVLQVASECLLGRAAAWWTAIGQRMRNILLTDYSLELWHSHIQVLCQSREQTRKTAMARQWQVHSEECWDYVWDKAALYEELDPRDKLSGVALISEILDGLPAELARMCRTEFSPNPSVSDLTRELQVLVPRWKRDADKTRRPLPPQRSPRTRLPDSSPPDVFADKAPPLERPPLSSSYDRSKIDTRPHPVTRRMTRCFTKPNGKVIYLSRNCSRCNEAHFDFEHDSLHPATAHVGFDEMGYEQWGSSDSDDSAVAKKLN